MLIQVHDELLFEVGEKEAEEAKRLIVPIMAHPLEPFGIVIDKITLETDAAVCNTWGDE
jgi:DNA polymerase I-like protein with 3'-5' exonuclease and polymerase domains